MQEIRPLWMVLAGSVLLLVAMTMLSINESHVLAYRQTAHRHGGIVVDASHGGPGKGNEGKMVRVTGMPTIVKPPQDPQFGIHATVPVMWRVTEMFQWREINLGGDIHYELEWVNHPVDWTVFKHRARHHNPAAMPFGGARFLAPLVRLDGFTLDPAIVDAMPGREALDPDYTQLHANLSASFHVVGNTLMTSKHVDSPQLGDVRVGWWGAPLQTVTVIARNEHGTLKPAPMAEDGRGFELQVGQREVDELLPDLPPRPFLPWLWRVFALILASAGAWALLRGVSSSRAGLVAATGIGVTVICGLASVMWVVHKAMVGGVLIVIATLALAGTAWLLYERSPPGP